MVLIVCCCSFIFATLDSNVGEVEGEEVGEGFEEDWELANQGNHLLISYVILLVVACFLEILAF